MTREADQIAQDYSAMGDSVALITAVIAGESMADAVSYTHLTLPTKRIV